MATFTVANGGGNINAASTYTAGVGIPGAADEIVFTTTSGQLTVNVTTTIQDINFSNYTNVITFNAPLSISRNITFGDLGGLSTYTVAGANALIKTGTGTLTSNGKIWPGNFTFGTGANYTVNLQDKISISGTTTVSGLNITITLSSNNVFDPERFDVLGDFVVSGTGIILAPGSGGALIKFTGTANQSVSWTATGQVRTDVKIDKTGGTLTFSGTINYNTGTFTYVQGTVNSGTSTLSIANATTTMNTNGSTAGGATTTSSTGINWYNLTLSTTLNLTSNFTVINTLTANVGTITRAASENLYLGGNLTMTSTLTSTAATVIMNGTGTWSGAGAVTAPLTINTTGTITISGSVTFSTRTLTYITATSVVTTGSTLNINASTTLDTNGITWNNFTVLGTNPTITLLSNVNITGTLTFALTSGTLNFTTGGNLFNATGNLSVVSGAINLPNDLYVVNATLGVTTANPTINLNTIYISGNLTTTSSGDCLGTTNVVLNGTGTWSNSSSGIITNNLTIDTLGTITISGIVRYGARTLTHLSGNVITDDSTLFLGFNNAAGTQINTPYITWFNLTITGSTTTTTLLNNVYVSNVLSFNISGANSVNGYSIYTSSFNYINFGTLGGTTFIIFNGNGTWRNNTLRNISLRTIIDCISLELIGNPYFNGSSITYLKGKIKSDNGTLNFNGNSTVNNFNKVVLNNVLITAGVTLTMNEFFCGSPEVQTNVKSTTTSNYTIAFTDNFEKITKFVNLTNCTLSKPQQLLMLTNTKKSSTNVRGIRYGNQSPNGIAKGKPSVTNTLTPGLGSFLVSEPIYN